MSPVDKVYMAIEAELIERAKLLPEFKYASAVQIVRVALTELMDRREPK